MARQDPDRLKKQVEHYRARLKAETALISDVSHEMRTPLTIAREALALALNAKGKPGPRQKVLMTRACEGIARAGRIVEELLEVSRIESGRFRIKYSLIGLNEFLHGIADTFRGLARERRIRLICRTPRDSVNIFIDPDRITQVITNLLENALKFSSEQGKIEISAAVFESKVRICVSDTGIGIEKKHLERIFSRFEQAPARRGKGLGLGLSIARELVERHGGEIWAESAPGRGSQFYFTLPRFYSTQMLDDETRQRINELLESDISLHLINLLIVNFQGFVRIAGSKRSRKVTEGLNAVIQASLDEFTRRQKSRDVFVSEFKQGECTIVIPKAEEQTVSTLCGLFREKVNGYLRSLGIRDCFINVGVLEFLYRDSRRAARSPGASIYVKKIFIGAEKRSCRRVSYHMRLEPVLQDASLGQTYSLDISRHGICFMSSTPLEANAHLTMNLALPHKPHPVPLRGRVAWVRPETGNQPGTPRYKIGVEFVHVAPARQRELNRFVDGLAATRACEPHNSS